MYCKSCYNYQWHNPMHNNWSYNRNPYYYNWNNYNWNNNWNLYYGYIGMKDYGAKPFVVNIDQATKQNNTYRTSLWTGENLQVTLMSINVGEDIGLEVHPTTDQFIRIEEGQGLVQIGDSKYKLDFQEMAYDDFAIMIPAGKWHNVTNTGNKPLKIYVIYAPPEHPYGTVHETKAIAMSTDENYHY
ncbi:cupin domain-containing protein [Aneurinibacillus migulanus]|uniref:Cupin n=1 Tax=Aneurinibacillus migulanus TaxID=47500 RepID=A0A0D1XII8_ANEMI|nr:cupin domain-containing protein [Aneurinibacillus migulanus]KIV54071.1 cupin [Aneurinibacillus migulanus]KON97660.1 cupin [Aneurinibacillus migulanus]MED0894415.1 cupin domain-containing protein [Aneurinibacillus migulanus]MED1617025.1 cupin domain-containing protein [Aneurinibacillus migulanus]SDJ35996.1 Mannose-6-phosphate isomerase, cupin superfamily [Aneurinibacillus migulanus]